MGAAALAALTRFAVDTRYPPETSTTREAAEALDLSEQFLEWAKIQIPAVGSEGEETDGEQRT